MSTDNEMMTIKEVAKYLKMGERSIRKLIKSGEIPHRKVLNKYRFVKDEVEKWMQEK